jgi:predicted dehydrogenase
MDRPNTLGEMIAVVAGGNGNHGSFHVNQLIKIGVGNIIVADPKRSKSETVNGVRNIIGFNGTLAEFLQDETLPLDLVIDASPDEHHISNLGLLLDRGDIGTICVEKPVATTRTDLSLFQDLKIRAAEQHTHINTCLPRIMDAPYVQLKNMIR